jgi:hypothetical protein
MLRHLLKLQQSSLMISGRAKMIKEFAHYTAWTDSMKYEQGFAGLIGYQRKSPDSATKLLWVIGPNLTSELDAENSADNMLAQILDINRFGKIIYVDGITL